MIAPTMTPPVDEGAASLYATHPAVLAEVLDGIVAEEPTSLVYVERELLATVSETLRLIADTRAPAGGAR